MHDRTGRRSPPGSLALPSCLLFAAVIGFSIGAVGCARWSGKNETIIQIDAKQNPAMARRLTLVGVREMGAGNIDRATEKFLDAIAADPTYGPAHSNLGLLHFEQGNLYQAVLAFEQAMEFMPSNPATYYNLALTLESAGRVHEAMDLYWQAVEMAPVNPVFLGNLVRLRVRLGEDGPDLMTQLQDLVLIETRPDWRRWADRQLALFFNDSLDRGPETPEFDARGGEFDAGGGDSDEDEPFRIEDRVIDLTPVNRLNQASESVEPESLRRPINEAASGVLPSPSFAPETRLDDPTLQPPLRSRPIPIRDSSALGVPPPSIGGLPGDEAMPSLGDDVPVDFDPMFP